MVKYCPQCGAPNEDDAKFCIRCGYKFPQEEKYFSKSSNNIQEPIVEKFYIEIINRGDAKKHFDEANRLYHLGKYAEAVKEYDEALAIDPNFKEAHYNKGLALYNLKRYEEAIEEYDKALAIDPNFKQAHNNKGLALYNLKRHEEAIKEFDKALAIDPNYKQAHNNKGLALHNLKRYEEAIEEYDKALAIDPYYTDANYNKNLIIKYKKWSKKLTEYIVIGVVIAISITLVANYYSYTSSNVYVSAINYTITVYYSSGKYAPFTLSKSFSGFNASSGATEILTYTISELLYAPYSLTINSITVETSGFQITSISPSLPYTIGYGSASISISVKLPNSYAGTLNFNVIETIND